jgi:hypothetical protein
MDPSGSILCKATVCTSAVGIVLVPSTGRVGFLDIVAQIGLCQFSTRVPGLCSTFHVGVGLCEERFHSKAPCRSVNATRLPCISVALAWMTCGHLPLLKHKPIQVTKSYTDVGGDNFA